MRFKTFRARVSVTLKKSVLDPQGKAIEGTLASLKFKRICEVRQGKLFNIQLKALSEKEAKDLLFAMCEKLLVNTVFENYEIEIVD
ncbi:phosphoribosylformylglycinamidine synthase subunit PurS [Candidatus Endowatersipora endosymbiont of Watersipora subatra]|uniref:phosphoribosylformylglycinamidine synthase subunit PurS n=1 Tax=Candidatus Endowatersipora endosymbiont of Watersipora subatra TaxID=3077946 RepID=UPI00312C921E